jgi:hypothetical protein
VSTIIHDLRCTQCGTLHLDTAIIDGARPACRLCGGEMKVSWEGGKPPGTDLYMTPQWNEGTGRYETSHASAEKYMRQEHGYEGGCGDKVHGARHEHRIVGTGYSYRGQGSRVSTAERDSR